MNHKKLCTLIGLSCAICISCSETNSDACGDGVCDADGGETSATCPADCKTASVAVCGNTVCELGETEGTCPQDCGAAKTVCGNGICETGETRATCPSDCGSSGAEDDPCGNGVCEANESITSCERDCYCGNLTCDGGETIETCPKDCAPATRCGDGTCNPGETRLNCPADCPPVCGDGLCEAGEYSYTCPQDCETIDPEPDLPPSVCGDGVCEDDEKNSCETDCKAQTELTQLTMDEFNALTETPNRFLYDYDEAMSPAENTAIEDFFAFPYPNDVRTDEHGRANLSGYPIPPTALIDMIAQLYPGIKTLIPSLVSRVQSERSGFSPIGGVYFRTSMAVDSAALSKHSDPSDPGKTASPDSCFQLINVEADSPRYGERVPVYVTYHRETNALWAKNTLVMRPVPGVGPRPGDRYAAVVTDCLTANSRYINQSNKLRYILEKAAPDEINDKNAYYVDRLKALEAEGKLGFKMNRIRAFTGYVTMNPAAEMDQMAKAVKGKGSIVSDENGVAKGFAWGNFAAGWTVYNNAYVYRGQFVTCNLIDGDYSTGIPTYTGDGRGEIHFDTAGNLVSACNKENVFFEVTVPRNAEMPAKGFPIAVYGHGTGGSAATHSRYMNSEGLNLLDAGVPMAMIGFDACLQGDRTTGAGDLASMYLLMLQNPVVIRESVRQTVNDMLVLYDIIDSGKLILPPLPGKTENTIFDPSYGLYMGHSQGSQEAGLLLGITDSVKNAFLSAGGGGVLLGFVDLRPDLSDVQVVGSMLSGKSIADMLSMLFGLSDGSISYDTFITNHIVQPLMDPVDPLNFAPRFIRDPAAGMHAKNIAQTVGLGDQSTPIATQFAMIASIGLPFVGKVFESAAPLNIAGLSSSAGSSVSGNIATQSGNATGGAIQYKYTGTGNPHFVIYSMASARQAYIDFFKSVLNGKPTVSVTGSQEGSN